MLRGVGGGVDAGARAGYRAWGSAIVWGPAKLVLSLAARGVFRV
jgi:hypothetical protein